MMSSPPARLRWPRSRKFVLSPRGCEVEQDYREKIVASRAAEGRSSFDSARAAWASAHNLQPDDGLYLAEVKAGPVSLAQIVASLETCGKTRQDAIAALERLDDNGLLSPAA